MRNRCLCNICHRHRRSGSLLYSTSRPFRELGPVQQRIQLERHRVVGVCKRLGPPFKPRDLTEAQLDTYRCLWD